MQKYFFFLTNFFLIFIIAFIFYRLNNLQAKKSYYEELYLNKTNNVIEGYTAPRGRILDRNGIILVDNESFNIITYRKLKDSTLKEIDIAYNLLDLINYSTKATVDELKDYFILENLADKYITNDEQKLYQNRKLTKEDIYNLKFSRITNEDLKTFTEDDSKAISLYYLMNKSYYYETKILKEDVNVTECAKVSEANLPGLLCETSFKRVIKDEEIASLYGTVSHIPSEEKDYYLNLGYNINDLVGISFLEKEYDEYLKGVKTKYLVNQDNSLTLLEEGHIGNDLVLSIDIKLEKEINSILKENLIKAKKSRKTELLNSAYVIVSDPNTGEIISLNGQRILTDNKNYTFKEVTPNLLTTSYTVGSVIKGATITVGYLNNLITPGQKVNDACIKLYTVPAKCSFRRRGWIDDITALKTSSNYYQFLLAIALTNQKYSYNMKLNATEEHFNIYRSTLENFGLGTLTGIDLPNETTGIRGNIIADDLLLNLSIGQYDTYTPLQLTQYINTIALNGKRLKLNLMKYIKKDDEVIKEYNPITLSTLNDTGFFTRIKEGLRQVLNGGTGAGYVDTIYNPAGKTGTSENYYDKNTLSITNTFAMFAPLDNPKYSIVIVTPNISYTKNNSNDIYTYPLNRYLAKSISKLVFDNY